MMVRNRFGADGREENIVEAGRLKTDEIEPYQAELRYIKFLM